MSITRADCERQGGTYVPSGPDGNGPACRFIDYSKTVGKQVTYTAISEGFSDWLSRTLPVWQDTAAIDAGALVQTRDDVVDTATSAVKSAAAATGLDHGIFGALSKALGIDLNLVLIVLVVFAFYVVKSGALGGVVRAATP